MSAYYYYELWRRMEENILKEKGKLRWQFDEVPKRLNIEIEVKGINGDKTISSWFVKDENIFISYTTVGFLVNRAASENTQWETKYILSPFIFGIRGPSFNDENLDYLVSYISVLPPLSNESEKCFIFRRETSLLRLKKEDGLDMTISYFIPLVSIVRNDASEDSKTKVEVFEKFSKELEEEKRDSGVILTFVENSKESNGIYNPETSTYSLFLSYSYYVKNGKNVDIYSFETSSEVVGIQQLVYDLLEKVGVENHKFRKCLSRVEDVVLKY